MFTVIVPFFNGEKYIDRLLASIPERVDVLLVDDFSDKHYWSNRASVLKPEKKGYFTGAVNHGIRNCSGDVLILNQDAYFTNSNWVAQTENWALQFDLFGERIKGNHPAWEDGYIHGTFMYISRKTIERIGLLDEVNYPLWGSTAEYQRRAHRAHLRVKALPEIPGFVHERSGARYGESIRTILEREPGKASLFIKTPPQISVVVPCYNQGRFIYDLVNSLVGGKTSLGFMEPQSFQDFEIVIVDDASTDNTAQILASLDRSLGIRVVTLAKNGGTSNAINKGIEVAVGRYITVMGADDMREQDSLRLLKVTLDANPGSFVYDNVMAFMDGQKIPNSGYTASKFNFPKLLLKNQVPCGIMLERSVWKKVGGYPDMPNGREDWAMAINLGSKGHCGIMLVNKGYLYRRHSQNRTLTNTTRGHREEFLWRLSMLFPHLYGGGKLPMACCGGGNSAPVVRTAAVRKAIPLDDGEVLVEYIGANHGTQTWYGLVSGARYKAGKPAPKFAADQRDLYGPNINRPGLLELRENGLLIFRLAPPDPTPKQAVVVEEAPVEEAAITDSADILTVPAEELVTEAVTVVEKPVRKSRKNG